MRLIFDFLKEKPGLIVGISSFVLVLVVVFYWSFNATPVPCIGAGDCVKYTDMTRMFASGVYRPVDYPFNIRVIAPWMASRMLLDTTNAFILLNALSSLIFAVSCYMTVRVLKLSTIGYIAILCWFFLHPAGFRFYYAIPVSVDPLSYAFIGIITYLFLANRKVLLWLFLFIALFVKESFVFVAILIMVSNALHLVFMRFRTPAKEAISILAIIFILLVYGILRVMLQNNFFPQAQEWEITTMGTIAWWAREVLNDPNRLVVWIAAFFAATGFWSSLAFGGSKLMRKIAPDEVKVFAYFGFGSIGYMALGLLAGSDMTRIIFNGNFFIVISLLLLSARRGLSLRHIVPVFVFSMILAVAYTKYFPSAIEYSYYDTKSILPLVWFVFISLLTTFFLSRLHKLKNMRNDD